MEAKRGASNDGQIIEKKMSVVGSVTRKKSPKVYKTCPKRILLEKW